MMPWGGRGKQLLDAILTPSRRNTSPLWPSLKGLITLVV
jgi:hypothetical protein